MLCLQRLLEFVKFLALALLQRVQLLLFQVLQLVLDRVPPAPGPDPYCPLQSPQLCLERLALVVNALLLLVAPVLGLDSGFFLGIFLQNRGTFLAIFPL